MKSITNSKNGVNNDIKKNSEIGASCSRTRQKQWFGYFQPSRSPLFQFFSSMLECNYFRLLLLKNFRRSQGAGAPPRPPLATPVIYPLVDVQVETKQGCHLQG